MVLETFYLLIGSLLGGLSLLWQIYDKVIARPKLIVDVAGIKWRVAYAPNSWEWFLNYECITWCRPWGAVISIPVRNVGRAQATDCRAKMRFRLVEVRKGKHSFDDWSNLVGLHWSENPEKDLDDAYRPISLGRNDTAYIDLIVYHTRSPRRPLLRSSCNDVEHSNPRIATVLTFYTKPFIRGDLPDKPCGWNPSPEFFKIKPASVHDIKNGFIICYEVEILVVCSNAQAKARLYLVVAHDDKSLAIYSYKNLDDVERLSTTIGSDLAKSVYQYVKISEDDPQPIETSGEVKFF